MTLLNRRYITSLRCAFILTYLTPYVKAEAKKGYAQDGQTSYMNTFTRFGHPVLWRSQTTDSEARPVYSCSTFWKAYARCRTGSDCIKVTMTIQNEPLHDVEYIDVSVVVLGECVHMDSFDDRTSLPNRRQLRGTNRAETADKIKNRGHSSSELYYSRLGVM